MPKVMYDRFIETSKDGIIALPASYFSRYYKNLADLDSNIRDDGNALAIDFSDDPILAEKTNVSPSVNMKKVTQSADRSGSNFILKHPQNPDTWHMERIFFDRRQIPMTTLSDRLRRNPGRFQELTTITTLPRNGNITLMIDRTQLRS
jgi:hypothetical protein